MTECSDVEAGFVLRASKTLSADDTEFIRTAFEADLGNVALGRALPSSGRDLSAWEVLIVANASVFLAVFVQRSAENAADALFALLRKLRSRTEADGRLVVENHDDQDRLEFSIRTVTIEEVRIAFSELADSSTTGSASLDSANPNQPDPD